MYRAGGPIARFGRRTTVPPVVFQGVVQSLQAVADLFGIGVFSGRKLDFLDKFADGRRTPGVATGDFKQSETGSVAVEKEQVASRTGYVRFRPEPTFDPVPGIPESSSGTSKVSAMSASSPLGGEKLEHGPKPADFAGSDGIRRRQSHGETLKQANTTCGPSGPETGLPVLEHGPCRHPLDALLATVWPLNSRPV